MSKKIIAVLWFLTLSVYGQSENPNVVFILTDDLGAKDLSCLGSEVYESPNIDKLGAEGMIFTQAYSPHPRCVPSRYGMITGRYPARVGCPGKWDWSGDEYTMSQAFKDAGYKTFFAGKWHLTKSKDGIYPEDVGFDINIGGGKAGSPRSFFAPYNKAVQPWHAKKAGIEGLDDAPEGEYLNDRLTDETIKFIKENKDQQFFVYLSHYAVHDPLQAKDKDSAYFKEKIDKMNWDGPDFIKEGTGYTRTKQNDEVYAGMIKNLDDNVGRIINLLKELNLDENTIIVFTSDHGGLSNKGYNDRILATSNLPLRAGKGHCYEGGIKIPLIVKWPNIVKQGSMNDQVVYGLDFYPTLLDAAQIRKTEKAKLDGESFYPALIGKEFNNNNREIFWHSPVGRPFSTGDTNVTVIREGDYKFFDFYDEGRQELYNIKNDFRETKNLIAEESEKAKELYNKIKDWRKDVNAYIKGK
ncbi:MAG: sulfatase [Melioribacteraceae bacterium]|nr:sulfatase [Melioribacteraceae bacterium]